VQYAKVDIVDAVDAALIICRYKGTLSIHITYFGA